MKPTDEKFKQMVLHLNNLASLEDIVGKMSNQLKADLLQTLCRAYHRDGGTYASLERFFKELWVN